MADARSLARWRLILGRYAGQQLGNPTAGDQQRYDLIDRHLDYLYGREYDERGTLTPRGGGHGGSVLNVPTWIRGVRDLFPQEVTEVITRHALERYDMQQLVTDAEVLKGMEPNYDLLKAVLSFKGMMNGEVLTVARELVRQVVEELKRVLGGEIRRSLSGRRDRFKRSPLRSARNLDCRRTIKRSLQHWDPEARRLNAAELFFTSKTRRKAEWDIILCIDCSGSMIDSVIHSAVMAAIFHGLPSLRVKLVAFDTNVVDLSEQVDDPMEVLMSVQLGGGTDIAGAVGYCAGLVEQPTRTIMIVVTDFYEGGSPARLIGHIKALRGEGVRVWGLAALDAEASPCYDHTTAANCAAAGAEIAALTPQRLAEWVATVVNG